MIVAIIQARMGSKRLPGKVLSDIAGQPMLWHVYHRLCLVGGVDRVIVATSRNENDDVIGDFCLQRSIACFRGDEADVLDRYYQTARDCDADAIIRVTADCPLIDPAVTALVIEVFKRTGCDYAANNLRYSYPNGLDVEIFSMAALERAWKEAKKPSEREHVTPFLRCSGFFRTESVVSDVDLPGQMRWTVDDQDDLEFVRKLFAAIPGGGVVGGPSGVVGFKDVLRILEKNPDLRRARVAITNEGYYRSLFQDATSQAVARRPLVKSQSLFARSKAVIPGCSQTFSKGYTQYVQGVAPIFLGRGKGSHVWDVDGNEYIDYVSGLLPNILGYAHPGVDSAVRSQMDRGISFSLPHPLEVELAEKLCEIIPCAEMVRFGKNGSDATAGAVRVARAFTGRSHIACCGYHGWQDWYVGSTTRNLGVPEETRGLTHSFLYNNLSSLEDVFSQFPNGVAAVIMEPLNFTPPDAGFLESVKVLCEKNGALFIFDEICTGFHFGLGGAQKRFGVTPDLACFGKAMGNGYPISCVVGRRDVMRLFEEVFFSFTFAGDPVGLVASLKVIEILQTTDVIKDIEEHGRMLRDGFNTFALQSNLSQRMICTGYPNWTLMRFMDGDHKDSLLEKSLFQQEVLKAGILVLSTHNLGSAHDRGDIEKTLEIYANAFKRVANFLSDSDPQRHLEGELIQPVFRVR